MKSKTKGELKKLNNTNTDAKTNE